MPCLVLKCAKIWSWCVYLSIHPQADEEKKQQFMLSSTICYFLAQTRDSHYHSRAAQTRWIENILNCYYEHITYDKASQKSWNSQYFVFDDEVFNLDFIVEAGEAFIYSWIKTIKLLAFFSKTLKGSCIHMLGWEEQKTFALLWQLLIFSSSLSSHNDSQQTGALS